MKETKETVVDSKSSLNDVFPFETENPSGVPGETEIAEDVVAAIVGHAVEQVEGVVRLGTRGVLRTITGIGRSTEDSKSAGVEVEAGKREAIFDIDITVEYGYSIPEVVSNVRDAAATALRTQVGLFAKEININVAALEFPDRIPSGRVE